ncbi:MAG: hypothetical protein A3K19_05080 [Lentisphaerae bacterium RIFOXYB12_FULL_65_16]|nr:MAG: hypothetical protein A3K18_35270 [Lentisphaerae bacterium RIFOXYA12_64_32]OGV89762.1 MAG: hypothetical protein A3K19_05080 [Lentisphaerae bacterium RIFOXYB12_FULL_65_16]
MFRHPVRRRIPFQRLILPGGITGQRIQATRTQDNGSYTDHADLASKDTFALLGIVSGILTDDARTSPSALTVPDLR